MIAVLNRRSEEDSDNDDDDDDPTQLKLSRLKLALKYDQKQVRSGEGVWSSVELFES